MSNTDEQREIFSPLMYDVCIVDYSAYIEISFGTFHSRSQMAKVKLTTRAELHAWLHIIYSASLAHVPVSAIVTAQKIILRAATADRKELAQAIIQLASLNDHITVKTA